MSNSYKTLKRKNEELWNKIYALNEDLHTVVLKPESGRAVEIKCRVQLEDNTEKMLNYSARRDCGPPFLTKGLIPFIRESIDEDLAVEATIKEVNESRND